MKNGLTPVLKAGSFGNNFVIFYLKNDCVKNKKDEYFRLF